MQSDIKKTEVLYFGSYCINTPHSFGYLKILIPIATNTCLKIFIGELTPFASLLAKKAEWPVMGR